MNMKIEIRKLYNRVCVMPSIDADGRTNSVGPFQTQLKEQSDVGCIPINEVMMVFFSFSYIQQIGLPGSLSSFFIYENDISSLILKVFID